MLSLTSIASRVFFDDEAPADESEGFQCGGTPGKQMSMTSNSPAEASYPSTATITPKDSGSQTKGQAEALRVCSHP